MDRNQTKQCHRLLLLSQQKHFFSAHWRQILMALFIAPVHSLPPPLNWKRNSNRRYMPHVVWSMELHVYAPIFTRWSCVSVFTLLWRVRSRYRFGINTIEITPHKSIYSKHSEQVQGIEEENKIFRLHSALSCKIYIFWPCKNRKRIRAIKYFWWKIKKRIIHDIKWQLR